MSDPQDEGADVISHRIVADGNDAIGDSDRANFMRSPFNGRTTSFALARLLGRGTGAETRIYALPRGTGIGPSYPSAERVAQDIDVEAQALDDLS